MKAKTEEKGTRNLDSKYCQIACKLQLQNRESWILQVFGTSEITSNRKLYIPPFLMEKNRR